MRAHKYIHRRFHVYHGSIRVYIVAVFFVSLTDCGIGCIVLLELGLKLPSSRVQRQKKARAFSAMTMLRQKFSLSNNNNKTRNVVFARCFCFFASLSRCVGHFKRITLLSYFADAAAAAAEQFPLPFIFVFLFFANNLTRDSQGTRISFANDSNTSTAQI